MTEKTNRKKKVLIGVLTPVTALLLAFFILCVVTMAEYSPTYLGRVLTHFDSAVTDYRIFPARTIQKSERPYTYVKNINSSLGNLPVDCRNGQKALKKFIDDTDTASFIVVKNDEIVYERYSSGYDENSINTSFSMAKSIVSLLVGKAIEKGYITSIDDPIAKYIGEFAGAEIGKITIEELLTMRSAIEYDEDKFLWFGDDSLTYWHPDLRRLALSNINLTDKYNGKFHYNNYHPLLLGIILERCTGLSVSQFFEREIWQKIGAESDACWSLDSDKAGFEKMESGINFRAVDFIKIGSAVLHGGFWNGTQIFDPVWLKDSTLCEFPLDNSEYENSFLDGKNIGYKYMWYCTPSANSGYDTFAWGKSDQILYISPSDDTVILRTGKSDGGVSNWPEVLKGLTEKI